MSFQAWSDRFGASFAGGTVGGLAGYRSTFRVVSADGRFLDGDSL